MQKKLGVIIQARLGSTRLKNKIDLKFYDGYSILDIVSKKLLKLNTTLDITLATGNNKENQSLEKYAKRYGFNFFIGEEENVLKRFIDASRCFNYTHILRICSDNPFIDIEYLNILINHFEKYESKNYDYISFLSKDKIPAIRTHLGVFAEIISLDALIEQSNLTSDIDIIQHVTKYIYENEKK